MNLPNAVNNVTKLKIKFPRTSVAGTIIITRVDPHKIAIKQRLLMISKEGESLASA